MIINKVVLTPEEERQHAQLLKQLEAIAEHQKQYNKGLAKVGNAAKGKPKEGPEWAAVRAYIDEHKPALSAELEEHTAKDNEFWERVEQRYIASFNKDTAALLGDVQEILDSITKEDFIEYIKLRTVVDDIGTEFFNQPADPARALIIDAYYTERYKAFYAYALHPLRVQLNALHEWGQDLEPLLAKVRARAADFYTEEPLDFPEIKRTRSPLKKEAEGDTEGLENQQSKRPKKIEEPLSKLSNTAMLFDFFSRENELDGQVSIIPLSMESHVDKRELTMNVSITYPEGVAKNLSPTDNRIYNATSWQNAVSGPDMTYTQLARAAGWKNPSAAQVEKVRKSVEHMRLIGIEWDNKAEAQAYKKNDTYATYKGYLYPVEIIEARKTFNGKLAEGYIRVLKPLPVMEFARERGEIATIPAAILDTKISLTDTNIAMQDYLIRRIERERRAANKDANRARGVKIIYDTLYKNTGANTKKKQRTLIKNLYEYLEELKEKNYITAYREETTKSTGAVGVVIDFH